MLLLRPIKILALCVSLASVLVNKADAGLYGFTRYNPYTKEERILHLNKVPQKIDNYRALMRANLLMLIRYQHYNRIHLAPILQAMNIVHIQALQLPYHI